MYARDDVIGEHNFDYTPTSDKYYETVCNDPPAVGAFAPVNTSQISKRL
jgi:hypothetical protein